jgi:hypothetical protein
MYVCPRDSAWALTSCWILLLHRNLDKLSILPCLFLKINLTFVLPSVSNGLSLQLAGLKFCKNFFLYNMLYEIKCTYQNTSSLTDLVSSLTCSSEVRRNVNKLSGLTSSVTPSQRNGIVYGQHIIKDKIKYYFREISRPCFMNEWIARKERWIQQYSQHCYLICFIMLLSSAFVT